VQILDITIDLVNITQKVKKLHTYIDIESFFNELRWKII